MVENNLSFFWLLQTIIIFHRNTLTLTHLTLRLLQKHRKLLDRTTMFPSLPRFKCWLWCVSVSLTPSRTANGQSIFRPFLTRSHAQKKTRKRVRVFFSGSHGIAASGFCSSLRFRSLSSSIRIFLNPFFLRGDPERRLFTLSTSLFRESTHTRTRRRNGTAIRSPMPKKPLLLLMTVMTVMMVAG